MTVTVHREAEDHWVATEDEAVVGGVHRWLAPDGNHRLSFDETAPAAYEPLLEHVEGPCMTFVDEADTVAVQLLREAGFEVRRRELQFEIPLRRTAYGLPDGYRLVRAHSSGIHELMALDAALREDVPGAAGWLVTEQAFREQTYDSPYFDPATYLLALDSAGRHVGLVRVWNGPRPMPRLGLIGVLPDHRRNGLARALVSAAFDLLVARGEAMAIAEADETNVASGALLGGFGARVTGAELEMSRV